MCVSARMQEQVAIIVGSSTSGLAIAVCLSQQSIPYIILEREDCIVSLWKKYSYDRLHFHLGKQFCELPHVSFPSSYPTYMPKKLFIQYLVDYVLYVSHFNIGPMYQRTVESAEYSEASKKWLVKARNASSGEVEIYCAKFLVVATGEATNPYTPEMVDLAKIMLKYFKLSLVDSLTVMLSKLVYGDLTKYGIRRPTEGPFYTKIQYGKYPVH
uniref:indole-3-pyruvate monooxygenase n=1 Tax=Quercus lobata TaxID=97700 RepID=A0A7N2N469_QUELO